MYKVFAFGILLLCMVVGNSISVFAGEMRTNDSESKGAFRRKEMLVIDHTCTDISKIPVSWISKARNSFRVWYGHTSHGSQITNGMLAINKGTFRFNTTGKDGALFYQEISGDLGHRGNLEWMKKTNSQLRRLGNDANVVIWSWCGGCSDNTEKGISSYLQAMTELETEYPDVIFIYMTGHLDGTGVDGNLNRRNNQIRKYCKTHKKVLFDFADIESFDPDGNSFLQLRANDGCFYDRNGDGRRDSNWCDEWIAKHPDHGIVLPNNAAHTRPLNGALKGRAFWWMMARLVGWNGKPETELDTPVDAEQSEKEMQKRRGVSINKNQGKVFKNSTTTVYASKFSNVFHRRNCPKLNASEGLIKFDTPQRASLDGGLPCNYCKP